MDIIVRNTPSPGASFTKNTKKSVIFYYEYCQEHINESTTFSDYRKFVCEKKHTNAQNDRNIFPLLKNLGFLLYTSHDSIKYSELFTPKGVALVKTFMMEKSIEDNKDSLSSKKYHESIRHINNVIEELIFDGIWNAVKKHYEMSYRDVLILSIQFLLTYNSFDKVEFCYMLYCSQNNIVNSSESAKVIQQYRAGDLDINVKSNTYDKKAGNATQRKISGISSITCYSYIRNLLCDAGIIDKASGSDNRFELRSSNREKAKALIAWEK